MKTGYHTVIRSESIQRVTVRQTDRQTHSQCLSARQKLTS